MKGIVFCAVFLIVAACAVGMNVNPELTAGSESSENTSLIVTLDDAVSTQISSNKYEMTIIFAPAVSPMRVSSNNYILEVE